MDKKQVYYMRCACCDQIIPINVYPEDMYKLQQDGRKESVQNIVPYLTPAERELFLSGYCDDCWHRIFQNF